MAAFDLEMHPEKTRLIEFGRNAGSDRAIRGEGKPETFNFLGFTHICSRTQRGRCRLSRHTRRDRMQGKLLEVTEDLRRRWHQDVAEQGGGWEVWCAASSPTTPCQQRASPVGIPPPCHGALATRPAPAQPAGSHDMARYGQTGGSLAAQAPHIPPLPLQRFRVKHPRWEPYAGMPLVPVLCGGRAVMRVPTAINVQVHRGYFAPGATAFCRANHIRAAEKTCHIGLAHEEGR